MVQVPDAQRSYEIVRDRKLLKPFVKGIETSGLENLLGAEGIQGKQVVFFPNHLSHFDSIGIGYTLLEHGIPLPIFLAGKNLDIWPFKPFFDKWGVIYVDRALIDSKGRMQKKKDHVREFRGAVQRAILNGSSLLDFLEGGRSYSGNIMEERKKGAIEYILQALKMEEMNSREVYGVNIAVAYYPKRIEEPFMRLLAWGRRKSKLAYYAADALAFATQPFRPKLRMHINFGPPYLLNDFARASNGAIELRDRVSEDVIRLYTESTESRARADVRG